MLRKFKVKINDKEYVVELEELGTSEQAMETTFPSETKQVSQPVAPTADSGQVINAPMPGNIIDVHVKAGDTVSENQVLLILEAMKMENEIVSPVSGTVSAVHAAKGDVIDVGQPMITIT